MSSETPGSCVARLAQQGAVAAHPALQQQDDCQEEEPRKEQEGPRPRRPCAVRASVVVVFPGKQQKRCGGAGGTDSEPGKRRPRCPPSMPMLDDQVVSILHP